ncbi:DUF1801 domain-containing protein [Rhizohabitans arisaemae]|uniref:DUF1801 domain-containing protein n=1 Tax=Rhizohabitans arisaemae TaxID=2720610 RepID=UPI0024B0C749|nr:DUF1801 domain-containing protein [Rhizohabitans arisaemae]
MAGNDGFTDRERTAMRERSAELKKEAKRSTAKNKAAADAQDVLNAIAALSDEDRRIATWSHEVITSASADLAPRLWYGAPAYAYKGKFLCFFRTADKDGTRYTSLGFNDTANLDDGNFWPTTYAVADIDEGTADTIRKLIARAMS